MTPTAIRTTAASLALALLPAVGAQAETCTLDQVPAATLLLPYFELSLDQHAVDDTVLTINNAESEPALVHVTFWTNWAQPTISFDFYLTGYDVQTISLRDAFKLGNLPLTADQQSDPTDGVSPAGDPSWDGSFPNCGNFFPYFQNPLIFGPNLDRFRNGHTGKPIAFLGGRCLGANLGDNVARGYVTLDSVSHCSTSFPTDANYFGATGTKVANDENTLWGDYVVVRPLLGDIDPQPLIHLEADADLASATGATFYGSLASAQPGGLDHREPLGSVWGVPTVNRTLLRSELIVWRDPTSAPNAAFTGLTCNVGPDWFPLPQNEVTCFDQQENSSELCSGDECFPLATQRVPTGAAGIDTPFDQGWCRLDLGLAGEGTVSDDTDYPGDVAQSYVTAELRYGGHRSSGLAAVMLRSACDLPAAQN